MPLIATHLLSPLNPLPPNDNLQVYCGLDNCLTLEVLHEIKRATNAVPQIYDFERALQGPMLELQNRGFLIDNPKRKELAAELRVTLIRYDAILQCYGEAILTYPLDKKAKKGTPQPWMNGGSPHQLKKLFYEIMNLKKQYKIDKGKRKLSVDREALEKLYDYLPARPLVNVLLAMRDTSKQLQVLETEIDADNRWRCSYNIGGTTTWRLSSSSSSEGTGSNTQNVSPELREMFIPDPGKKLGVIDYEQAESREVGWLIGILFDDWTYYDAVLLGDIHTYACRLAWPALPWAFDLETLGAKSIDRALADAKFYRHFSRRDLTKKLGHGSNYGGLPPTMAKHAKIETAMAREFQENYFRGFPGIPRLHQWIKEQLLDSATLTNIWGATRHFFGRPDDASTFREAMAFLPQSATAIRTNLGLWRIWRHLYPGAQILAQTHDSVTFQYPTELEPTIIPAALYQMENIPITHTCPDGSTRSLLVPGEPKVGWNWAPQITPLDVEKAKAKGFNLRANPWGLRKLKPGSVDERNSERGGLD